MSRWAPPSLQVGGQLVFLLVGGQQLVDLLVAHGIDHGHQVADAVGVHLVAKLDFGLYFVAFGHGHVAHVVAEAHEFRALPVGPGAGHAAPDAQAFVHGRALPVAYHHLALQAHPRADEAKLPVAVRRLVGVHEVHVNVGPRNVAVELGVQMRQRLLQDFQAVNPHFGRREGVHPGNQAHAVFGGVGLLHQLVNLLRGLQNGLVDNFDGQLGAQLLGNFLRVAGHFSRVSGP